MSEKKPRPDPAYPRVERRRTCLMCRHAFASAWVGERVCGKCKGSRDWRMGYAAMDREHNGGGTGGLSG